MHQQFLFIKVLPSTESCRNSGVNGHCDAVHGRGENVSRVRHVDLLDKVVVLHDFTEFFDHDVGRIVDLAKEVLHIELLERAQKIFDSESAWICVIVRGVVVTQTEVKSS
jgi:hypothetical protein